MCHNVTRIATQTFYHHDAPFRLDQSTFSPLRQKRRGSRPMKQIANCDRQKTINQKLAESVKPYECNPMLN
jgi:hypothetical protein